MQSSNILKYLSYGSAAAVIVMMMAATVLEKLQGTPAAMQAIYHSPIFIALWAIAAVAGLIFLFRGDARKRPFTMLLHCALAVILAGALVTHIWGEQGEIHLHEGETLSAFELEDGSSSRLPFSIRLDSFAIDYHTGSRMPSDYRSEVVFLDSGSHPVTISMNHIGKYRGYRFYQADYDEDGTGSILAVSHDPFGVGITYAGYLLLLISMIGFFFQRDTPFRAALHRMMAWGACLAGLLLLPGISAAAAAPAGPTQEIRQALGGMYVYYGHRVCPLDTYLQEKGLDETLASLDKLKLFPVAAPSGSPSWYAAADKLPEAVLEDEALWTFVTKSPDLVRESLEEGNVADAMQILSGIKAYQEKTAAAVIPSAGRVRAERAYIRIARPRVQFMLSLALGLILFVLTVVLMSKGRKVPSWVLLAGAAIAFLLWLYLTVCLGLRWYVSGTGPWVGRYSVMMLMAWLSMLAVLLLFRKFPLIEPLGFLLAGFTMLLASRESVSPQIMPLMPVLQSPLLSIHVVSMMMSYTLFGLVAFNGVMGLCVKKGASEQLQDVSLVLLYPAVFLLTFGTFLGAVWANISWGSYWAWDPKETWALITMMIYAMMLHGGALRPFRSPRFFHIYSIIAFVAVLITYFGVNLILGGMHSYGA